MKLRKSPNYAHKNTLYIPKMMKFRIKSPILENEYRIYDYYLMNHHHQRSASKLLHIIHACV